MATSKQIKGYAKANNCSTAEATFHFVELAKKSMPQGKIDRRRNKKDLFDSKGHPRLIDVLKEIYDDNQQTAHSLVGGLLMDCIQKIDFLEDNANRGNNTHLSENAAHDLNGNLLFQIDPFFVDIRHCGKDLALMAFNSYINDWKKGKRCLLPTVSLINGSIEVTFAHMLKGPFGETIVLSIQKLKMPNGKYTTNIGIAPEHANLYKEFKNTIQMYPLMETA